MKRLTKRHISIHGKHAMKHDNSECFGNLLGNIIIPIVYPLEETNKGVSCEVPVKNFHGNTLFFPVSQIKDSLTDCVHPVQCTCKIYMHVMYIDLTIYLSTTILLLASFPPFTVQYRCCCRHFL